MKWLMDLEEKANVDIEWQQISADWDQKKSALLQAGKYRICCLMLPKIQILSSLTDYLRIWGH